MKGTQHRCDCVGQADSDTCCSSEENRANFSLEQARHFQIAFVVSYLEAASKEIPSFKVRRRLALQADSWKGASPAVSTRPHRSNLALRLQTAMNLQVTPAVKRSMQREHPIPGPSNAELPQRSTA